MPNSIDKQIKPLKDTFQFLALGSRSCIAQDPDNAAKVRVWIGLITRLRCSLDWTYLRLHFTLSRFFPSFFLPEVGFTWGTDLPVGPVHCARNPLALWMSTHWSEMTLFVGLMHCSRDPQTSFFTQTLIKNRSHSTIHIFKNYFATMFSVFRFQQNKLYPNEP